MNPINHILEIPMKLNIFAGAAIVLVLALLTVSAASTQVDRVVAVVNSDVITLSELNRSFAPILERIEADPRAREDREVREEARRYVLDRMINELLMKQEAERLNMEVREADIDAEIENLLAERNMTRRQLLEGLAEEGTSIEEHREMVRREILKSRVVGREIRARITVSDADIGAYYREHRDRYEGNQAVRIQQILTAVPRDADTGLREEGRARAEQLLTMLMDGAAFEEVVSRYSDGPESRTGGDLGFIERGTILPQVEEAAFSLDRGRVSEVIESPAGFHIIRVIDRRGGGLKPLEEVRHEIINEISNVRMEERFQDWIEKLRERAYIEIRL